MNFFRPTFCLTLHETVRSEVKPDPFWQGAGLLLIENFPLSPREAANVQGGSDSVLGAILGPLVRWITSILGIPGWKSAQKALKDNPHYALLTRIADRFKEIGGWLPGRRWTRYLEYFEGRDPLTADGRLTHGPEFARSDWRTITDYALGHWGCPGVTTESFKSSSVGLRGLDERVHLQLLYTHAVLDILDEEAE